MKKKDCLIFGNHRLWKQFLPIMLTAGIFLACSDLTISDNDEGRHPEKGIPRASLCAERTIGKSITMQLTLGESAANSVAEFYLRSNLPFDKGGTVWLEFSGDKFVKEYSESTGVEYKLLPAAFYKFKLGNSIEISAGTVESERNRLTVSTKDMFGNVIAPGRYLLPVVGNGGCVCELDGNSILIDLTVRKPYTDPDGYELYEGKDMMTVFYVNTSMFDPRLANDMVIMTDWGDGDSPKYGIGNIVNLRMASVSFDETSGRVSALPSNDLRFILEHYTERVLPVQESGRKVCICIESGGKGAGFCNFTDEQIADFTASVKRMVEKYGLDGINLWDRGTGYNKEDGTEMNTTSYPKLIRALRQALGNQKILTLVDYREPTAYFDDVQKTGGIAVGDYIDYAWHGYNNPNEFLQVVDPWAEDKPYHSKKYRGTKIAGLDHTRYGCIHWAPRKNEDGFDLEPKQWCEDNRQNALFVFYDIESILQHGGADGGSFFPGTFLRSAYNMKYAQELNRLTNKEGTGTSLQYGKWLKNW